MNKNFSLGLLTLFGIGQVKNAPGTIASLVTCLLYLFLYFVDINPNVILLVVIIISIYSIILIDKFSNHFKTKDPQEIVIDEFIGQSIPLILIYYETKYNHLYIELSGDDIFFIFLAFITFRIFDIFKPYPINIIDKNMKGGLGVVLDDIVAGIYSLMVILIIAEITGWSTF